MIFSFLKVVCFTLLRVMARHYEKRIQKEYVVEYRQEKESLVLKDGIPADRKGWLYLPFLEEYSSKFQPPEEGEKKIYRGIFPPGTVLEIKKRGKRWQGSKFPRQIKWLT